MKPNTEQVMRELLVRCEHCKDEMSDAFMKVMRYNIAQAETKYSLDNKDNVSEYVVANAIVVTITTKQIAFDALVVVEMIMTRELDDDLWGSELIERIAAALPPPPQPIISHSK